MCSSHFEHVEQGVLYRCLMMENYLLCHSHCFVIPYSQRLFTGLFTNSWHQSSNILLSHVSSHQTVWPSDKQLLFGKQMQKDLGGWGVNQWLRNSCLAPVECKFLRWKKKKGGKVPELLFSFDLFRCDSVEVLRKMELSCVAGRTIHLHAAVEGRFNGLSAS